ncbi:hypothetical protein GGI15_003552 [Coemansia interrupta]|uniref:Uncharacterized protein n=1 Tax=Coemansia interrupta TaxID=1126814 RepID=A0A9W8H8N8_9FUNG|nr:hypothetical protein GGI15_003552 [Coemansia interrupta]
MNFSILRRTLCPSSSVVLLRGLKTTAPKAMAAIGSRMYTKAEMYTEADHINPVEFQRYLQSRDRELKGYLVEESEILASESFNADASLSEGSSTNGSLNGRAVNEEFAKQIHDLLNPNYGE